MSGQSERTTKNGLGSAEGRPQGIITALDKELIALIGIARYLSTRQAHELLRRNKQESVSRRRLAALAGLSRLSKPNRVPKLQPRRALFNPPYLRRILFRSSCGERSALWALTPHGFALACQVLGSERKVNREDISEAFLDHSNVLTDLFVDLAKPMLEAGCPAKCLPFRWRPSDTTRLPWEQYDATVDRIRARRIIPDAVLEIPSVKRRFFIECEMGSHSIIAASDEKAGATLAKVERYDEFFAGPFYHQTHADKWPAEVLFLVRTDGRRDAVNAAIKQWTQGRTGLAVAAQALTHAQAAAKLFPLLPVQSHSPLVAPAPALLVLQTGEVETIRRFYQESLRRLDDAGQKLRRPTDPDFLSIASQLRAILTRLTQRKTGAAS